MSKNIFTYLSVFFISLILCSCTPPEPKEELHIYLCFGQSNMEGTGAIEPQDTTVVPRFVKMEALDCPALGRVKGEWNPAVPPICNCSSGLSPVDYFGRAMVDELPEHIKVGVVSVAIGGCDIRLFDKDIYMDYDSTYAQDWFVNKVISYNYNPYQHLIDIAKDAQKDGQIKGILLHQGETNTGDTLWPTYVQKIYGDMLTDLSLNASNVPLIAGEVVSVDSSCCAKMNPIINSLPDFIPTAHVVSSQGLTAQDPAHFDSEGYREFGRRYAQQMMQISQVAEKQN